MASTSEPFYLRYYSGHSGRFGHEFLVSRIRVRFPGGRRRPERGGAVCQQLELPQRQSDQERESVLTAPNTASWGKITDSDNIAVCVSSLVIDEIRRIVKSSEIMKEDDGKWPQKNKDGRQELEIKIGNDHISFETAKIGSLVDVTESSDPEGLRVFYYLVQDLKALVFSLISLHFKIKPIS
ncbi:uncharacterized protein E0L32_007808 [Thyridium curvatum]|uniref:Mago nashi-like protein n=1 Tax=Thyridium curvatum TaxID=1093900 RepID=A0A507AVU4_9PEZI|nr:uncharacterized protein E0L32_007808 [Thyridium curvatum]TPX11597.1 hypothetical protein E0L32_007808 [Thyridium curvatum]